MNIIYLVYGSSGNNHRKTWDVDAWHTKRQALDRIIQIEFMEYFYTKGMSGWEFFDYDLFDDITRKMQRIDPDWEIVDGTYPCYEVNEVILKGEICEGINI